MSYLAVLCLIAYYLLVVLGRVLVSEQLATHINIMIDIDRATYFLSHFHGRASQPGITPSLPALRDSVLRGLRATTLVPLSTLHSTIYTGTGQHINTGGQ